MDYDQIKKLIKTQNNSRGIDLTGVIRVISKRKIFIILSFILVFSAGYIYLKTAAHIYESTVLLKKEGDNKNNSERDDPYLRLISLRSQDDITTEMALIKTKSVLDRVVKNSSDFVSFLNKLETDKIQTDLKIGELLEKENQLLKVSEKKGYFDESYLSPSETYTGGGNAFSTVQNQLSALEVRRIELLQKETESHPDVVSIDNQIAQLKKQLSSYNQNTLTAYKIIINSLQGKKRSLENLINQYQGKVQGLPGKETKIVGLMRDKDVYGKIFNLLLDKREELRVKEIAQFQDITVVDPATLPIFPVSPNSCLLYTSPSPR